MLRDRYYCKLDAIKLGIDTSTEIFRSIKENDEECSIARKSASLTITDCMRNLRDLLSVDIEYQQNEDK